MRTRLKLLIYSVDIFSGTHFTKTVLTMHFQNTRSRAICNLIIKCGMYFRYIYSVVGTKCEVIPTNSCPSPQTSLMIYYFGIKSELNEHGKCSPVKMKN